VLKRFLRLAIIIICFVFFIPEQKVKAETDAKMLDNGDFNFTTMDTKATTDTTWETMGFTVRRDKSYGNPLKDKNHATFWLQPGQKIEKDIGGGKTQVTFFLTKQQVNEALDGTPLKNIRPKDDLYLNGIIKVHNGQHGPGPYYTLDGIKFAETWNDCSDFDDRFDVHITYEPGDEKYPVTITYQLYQANSYIPAGTLDCGEYQNHDEFKLNSKKVPDSKIYNKETYYLYRTYYQNLQSTKKLGNRKSSVDKNIYPDQYADDLKYIRDDRSFTVQGAKEKDGLNIVAIYRRYPERSDNENEEEINKEYEETDPTAVIRADTRDNETYDVEKGIPGTESLYANAFTSNYLAGSTFTSKYGTNYYTVNVKKTFNLYWTTSTKITDPKTGETTTKTEEHTDTRDMTYTYNIPRDYSYWIISKLGVYSIDNAILYNAALPGAKVTLTTTGYNPPTVDYVHNDDVDLHLIEPKKTITVDLGSESVNSSSVPSREYRSEAEAKVPQIKCKNDKLIFNGKTIMSDSVKEKATDKPIDIPSGLEEVGENVLYKSNLVIPSAMANGEYETTGTVKYKPVVEIKPDKIDQTYEIEDINSIIIHTPTVCDAQVQSNYKDNQMIKPDMSRASLVLDRPFNVTLPTTGNHQYYLGYGYRDYAKYIENRQVKFPFDVYCGNSVSGTFIPNGSWTSVGENTLFYLPSWVNEGLYTINFRSIAINASANNSIGKTEELANLELQNYVATDTVNVEVSGRIYGLNMYDISDYPIWQDVFRIPDSLSLTGFKYTVGDKDQNGNNNGNNLKYTLALVNGEHPKYSNIGAVKTGYVTRFNLKTIGNMYSGNDYVSLAPTFYYVDSSGKKRQEADIYYSETFNGKKNIMVKMGSPLDLENKKSLRTGDPYLSIPEKALNQTAYYSGLTLKDWKAQQKNIFTYTNIMLPGSLRTFVGHIANVPDGVMESAIAKSVQNWYGEYYLPSEIHVVPKGFNINEYIKNNGGLTYKENFWLKNGYIIVNFHIETIQNGKRHLSYINADNEKQGYCNMWKREGYQYKKADYKGNEFSFIDGDYVLYYTDKSAANDYTSAGTH
jgi:hypothetical protein